MKPIIQDFIKQATYTVKGANGVVWGDNVKLEKLIELLVMECMKVVSDGKYSVDECRGNTHRIAHNNARSESMLDIKKHFGV